jgi:6-pyruvoyltetrahydropterin/6-carboxytetrahydropterin synthase
LILTIYTEGFFNSAHFLKNYDGKCAQLHGHTWKVCVWIKGDESKCNHIGLLWDFNNLNQLIDSLDHKNLNNIIKFNPTVENITLYIYQSLKKNRPELQFKIRTYESIIKKESYCETGDFE